MTISKLSSEPEAFNSVRNLLRQATRQHHAQLDSHPMLAGLLKANLSLQQYQHLLTAFLRIYQPLERCICQFIATQSIELDYTERLKSPKLLNDLAYFNSPSLNSTQWVQIAEIGSLGELIGVLYVVEGSTLGGQLIAKSLAAHHQLNANQGAMFFNGYGGRTPEMWQAFMAFAECIADDENECQIAVSSACRTFVLFSQVMEDFVSA